MEKEIEALEKIKDMLIGNGCNSAINDYVDNLILPIKQVLTELKQIKESEPSEAFISGEKISIPVDEKHRVFRSTKNYTLKEALEILNPSNRISRTCEKRQAFYIIKKELEKR